MVKLRRVHRPGRLTDVWVEENPVRCPGCGERYRGGHVAVGWLACACRGRACTGHRTLYCRDCGTEVFLPTHLGWQGPIRPEPRGTGTPQ